MARIVRDLLTVALVLGVVLPLSAQTGGTTGRTSERILGQSAGAKKSTGGTELPPVERSIEPTEYVVGPGDQLVVSIPALESMVDGGEFPVVVAADNSIVLPRGVVLDTRNMTLARLRQEAAAVYRARGGALAEGMAIQLVRPRSIYVTVRGDVRNPNRFVLSAADRVTTAIDLANEIEAGSTEAELLEVARVNGQLEQENTGSRRKSESSAANLSVRHVVIRHNDGTTANADLLRYQAFGRSQDNPTLREGDEIHVRKPEPTLPTVAAGGAVNAQVIAPWIPGDNALFLLRLSAGLHPQADARGAVLARSTTTGLENVRLDLSDTVALAGMLLNPGDRLIVPYAGGQYGTQAGFVSVRGAIVNPSAYPVISGETKLSEVIAAAGGFTADASLNGAYIERQMDPELLQARTRVNDPSAGISSSSLTLEDTTRYKYDQELHKDRVSADFVSIFQRGDRSLDVSLRSGDEVVVPRNPRTVYVSGRVLRPGAVTYREGADVNYYVQLAGGFTPAADVDRTHIVKFGTGQMVEARTAAVMSGDEIYVPGSRDTPARTSLEQTQTVLAITSGLASLALTVIYILNELKK